MKLNVFQVALVGIGTFSREDIVILALNKRGWRLIPTEILLPLWIKR
jgi:hypothetical protein